jgi:hypothetical protein
MQIANKRTWSYEVFEFTNGDKVDRHLCTATVGVGESQFDIPAEVFKKYPKIGRIAVVSTTEITLQLQDRMPGGRKGVIVGQVYRRGEGKFCGKEYELAKIEPLRGTPIGGGPVTAKASIQ